MIEHIFTKQIMQNIIAYHLLNAALPVPEQWLATANSPQFSKLFCTISYGVKYSLGQLFWFCPIQLYVPLQSLTGRTVQEAKKLKHPWPFVALLSNN